MTRSQSNYAVEEKLLWGWVVVTFKGTKKAAERSRRMLQDFYPRRHFRVRDVR